MRCIKTGFSAYIESQDLYIHGDAFILPVDIDILNRKSAGYDDQPRNSIDCPDWLLLRVSYVTRSLIKTRHIALSAPEHWFDEGRETSGRSSTLLVAPNEWAWLGYNGQTRKD